MVGFIKSKENVISWCAQCDELGEKKSYLTSYSCSEVEQGDRGGKEGVCKGATNSENRTSTLVCCVK